MNSIILPNVTLGDRTIVAAGSIVTKSFVDGNCIVAGNPAQLLRSLDPPSDIASPERDENAYHGYIRHKRFPAFVRQHLSSAFDDEEYDKDEE